MDDSFKMSGVNCSGEKEVDIFIESDDREISLTKSTSISRRHDFLPITVSLAVLIFSFFVGNNFGDFLQPVMMPIMTNLTSMGKTGLATVDVAGKKISQKIKINQSSSSITTSTKIGSDDETNEPSLNQSWRELIASVSVGGSKLKSFGHGLWNVVANSTANVVDWLAYGTVNKQEKMVKVVSEFKIVANSSVNRAFNVATKRIVVSTLKTKTATLAMSNKINFIRPKISSNNQPLTRLKDFDQKTTDGLINIIAGTYYKILSLKQNTLTGLVFVEQSIINIPNKIIVGSNEIFWQPLAEQTGLIGIETLALINYPNKIIGDLTVCCTNSIRLIINFFTNFISHLFDLTGQWLGDFWLKTMKISSGFSYSAKVGYAYIAGFSGPTTDQMAAIKFMGFSNSAKEFFAMIVDRIKLISNWLVNFSKGLWQATVKNWLSFLGFTSEEDEIKKAAQAAAINNDQLSALEEKIKNQLRNDLRQEMAEIIRRTSANNLSSGEKDGLIVVPSSGDTSADEKLKTKIQQMFSDQVMINFDANRKAGLIAPIFNPSDNYVFLLAPVKK